MTYITVHLAKPVGPKGTAQVYGVLKSHDELGVRVYVQEWGEPGHDHFFPTHLIERIDYSEVDR